MTAMYKHNVRWSTYAILPNSHSNGKGRSYQLSYSQDMDPALNIEPLANSNVAI